ncbi:THxN family PEP-CTERM protein [Paracoccus sp. 11-3]|uniref:THxN family PEP-CTERM protein n=1 Tax=Paracoccus amoyensis TaxID=2760093 RepID=A0A926GAM4_9RHOB|nr:THxN family PEP-CTERM protein [Paracoccus amoyensis]MBC9245535.1 THxN family PEP-CTERM protein [Paracoccus amoyensis]
MRRSLRILSAASALTLIAAAAQAATLNVTNVSAVWSNPIGGAAVTTGMNGDVAELRWGTGAKKSGYDFDPLSPSGPHSQDTVFNIGTFTHHNFPIGDGTGISGATLDVEFTFYLGSDSSTTYTRMSQFVFDHNETPNSANPCANGLPNGDPSNAGGCADLVTASTNPATSETFTITEGGITRTYVFDVTGFNIGEDFWTKENMSNSATLQAQYTYEENIAPVPLPAAAWLLMAGVGGFAAVGRRRRRS